MPRSRPLVVPLVAALLLALTPPAEAGTRSESKEYVGFVGDAILLCDREGSPVNLGGACFWPEPTDEQVTITIVDDAGWTVGGYYGFFGPGGGLFGLMDNGPFCGSATVPVPEGATYMEVSVDGVFMVVDCPSLTGVGPATAGTISLQFVTA